MHRGRDDRPQQPIRLLRQSLASPSPAGAWSSRVRAHGSLLAPPQRVGVEPDRSWPWIDGRSTAPKPVLAGTAVELTGNSSPVDVGNVEPSRQPPGGFRRPGLATPVTDSSHRWSSASSSGQSLTASVWDRGLLPSLCRRRRVQLPPHGSRAKTTTARSSRLSVTSSAAARGTACRPCSDVDGA
jgi:hypothetical protein